MRSFWALSVLLGLALSRPAHASPSWPETIPFLCINAEGKLVRPDRIELRYFGVRGKRAGFEEHSAKIAGYSLKQATEIWDEAIPFENSRINGVVPVQWGTLMFVWAVKDGVNSSVIFLSPTLKPRFLAFRFGQPPGRAPVFRGPVVARMTGRPFGEHHVEVELAADVVDPDGDPFDPIEIVWHGSGWSGRGARVKTGANYCSAPRVVVACDHAGNCSWQPFEVKLDPPRGADPDPYDPNVACDWPPRKRARASLPKVTVP